MMWNEAVEEIPELGPQDVVEITRVLNNNSQKEIKEVESVEENPENWQKRVHFLDGSHIRKSNTSGNWGWFSVHATVRPLRQLEIKQKNS